ncbi:MAG: hypothetical protein H6Q74_884 [Firmicutes bacterium]|nr:hypothetical protein [Bacillota bacterium]
MKELRFAVALEASIRKELEDINRQALPELCPVVQIVSKFQAEFELLLDRACSTDVDLGKYPEIDAALLLGSDQDWQQAVKNFSDTNNKALANLTLLWRVLALIENSQQYYQQAALNSPYPLTKLFLSSLTQTKLILRRRLDGVLRAMYNEVWSSVGFAPFVFGKD